MNSIEQLNAKKTKAEMITSSLIQNLLICTLSGLISGIIFASFVDEDIKNFWSKWFPGLTFGLLFSIGKLQTIELTISYSVLSGIFYFMAVSIALAISRFLVWISPKQAEKGSLDAMFEEAGIMLRASPFTGLLAGAFGSFGLITTLKLLADIGFNLKDDVTTIIVGAIAGGIFLPVIVPIDKPSFATFRRSILAFVIWQASVGVFLFLSINGKPLITSRSSFNEGLKIFLQSPAIQLIGLIASILEITSFIRRKEVPGK